MVSFISSKRKRTAWAEYSFKSIFALGLAVVLLRQLSFLASKHEENDRSQQTIRSSRRRDDAVVSSDWQQFPSVLSAVEKSELVGIYFAASWCPMSTPITELLAEYFPNASPSFSILYVSSDRDKQSFREYVKPSWLLVPYENKDERADLKRFFKVCAKSEMADLGIDERNDEIPSLIVISKARLVSTYCVKDIKEHGATALDIWTTAFNQVVE